MKIDSLKIFAARICDSNIWLIFVRRQFFHEKIWLGTNHERMLVLAIKLIFHESVSGALDTVWIGLFRIESEDREGSASPIVDAFLHWMRTGRSFVEDNAGSLCSFNIFRQQAARVHLVIKSVWSANIADPMHVAWLVQPVHTHAHTCTRSRNATFHVRKIFIS